MRPAIQALGSDVDELVETLAGWSATIVAAGGYVTGAAQLHPG